MSIKIVVTRHYPKEIESIVLPLLKELFDQITLHGGFLFGETLINMDNPDEHLIISTWNSMEEWRRYNDCARVTDIRSKIDLAIGETTQRRVFKTDAEAHAIYNPAEPVETELFGPV